MTTRKLLRIGAVAMASALSVAACGGGPSGTGEGGTPEFVSIATGGTGGAYYPIGGAMGSVLANQIDGINNATAETTGGSVENLQLLANQDVELAMAQNDAVYNAINGEGDFEEPADIRTISMMYVNVLQIATTQDRGIQSFSDLAGKSVSVGDAGSATELFTRQVTQTLGMSYDDFGDTQRLPFDDQTTAIRNNQLDAGSWVVGPGVSSIQDLASSEDLQLVSFSDAEVKKVTDKYPYYIAFEIPAGTYQGQDQPVQTLGTWNTLAMHADADPAFVREVTQIVHENVDQLEGAHPSAGDIAPENVEHAIAPVHPGAMEYFEQAGVEVPQELRPE
jgi:uncharacterized protein